MRRSILASAALMALAGSGMIAASPSAEPGQEPRRTRHKPSGNTPVPGGGTRERARRLARMNKTECETPPVQESGLDGAEHGGCGTDPIQRLAVVPTISPTGDA